MRLGFWHFLVYSLWILQQQIHSLNLGARLDQDDDWRRQNNIPHQLKQYAPYLRSQYDNQSRKEKKYFKDNNEFLDDEDNNNVIIIVECTESPLFFCTSSLDNCAALIEEQHRKIIHNVLAIYPLANALETTQKLANTIFFQLPKKIGFDVSAILSQNSLLLAIDGVKRVLPHQNYYFEVSNTIPYIGVEEAQQTYCVTGDKVRVAVFDSGIDYTHKAFGGPGTTAAYRMAYGAGPSSVENTKRDGLFPTERVVDGHDFLGGFFSCNNILNSSSVEADDDPIDVQGHGTTVASLITAVAPNAQLIAVKICRGICPQFAILKGFEYILDPNNDTLMDDKVDVVNLSIGTPFIPAYYDLLTEMLRKLHDLGVTVITAVGNLGNIPYSIGGLAATPYSISVCASGRPDQNSRGFVRAYSSRGPGDNDILKPDICAPSGSTAAAVGTGDKYRRKEGTSFASPIVTGAVALIKERCPNCSPLAVKALLMNNANRNITYRDFWNGGIKHAPVTRVGAGELNIKKSLDADFWAYSEEDLQPSISLGLINAASDVLLHRKIRVINFSSSPQTLTISSILRGPLAFSKVALQVKFISSTKIMNACKDTAVFELIFHISAVKAPPSYMTSTGKMSRDGSYFDPNEFGGYVIIQSKESSKEISLPFQAVIRQAAHIKVTKSPVPVQFHNSEQHPSVSGFDLTNYGEGVAQIDTFQLLDVSKDDPESNFAGGFFPADFRAFGYRTIAVNETGCSHLVEFAITTWEQQRVAQGIGIDVLIDMNGDDEIDYILFISEFGLSTPYVACMVFDSSTLSVNCTGFAPDHGTNTANIVLRACSDDIGLTQNQLFNVSFVSSPLRSFDEHLDAKATTWFTVEYPNPYITAPSYDVNRGEILHSLGVGGKGNISQTSEPLGLMLITNAYRRPNSTGAATPISESLILLRRDADEGVLNFSAYEEVTTDRLVFPMSSKVQGPGCSFKDIRDCVLDDIGAPFQEFLMAGPENLTDQSMGYTFINCILVETPRVLPKKISTKISSAYPSLLQSDLPSNYPSTGPSLRPSEVIYMSSDLPSLIPSDLPSSPPSDMPSLYQSDLLPSVTFDVQSLQNSTNATSSPVPASNASNDTNITY